MRKFKNPKLLLAILIALLAGLNLLAFRVATNNVTDLAQSRLQLAVSDIEHNIEARIAIYSNVLYGAKAFLEANDDISSAEWSEYIGNTEILSRYQGIEGFGYAPAVTLDKLEALKAEAVKQTGSDFTIYPTDPTALYVPLLYLEREPNQPKKAIGFNMYSESIRRSALDYAIDNNTLAITDRIVPAEDAGKPKPSPGVVLFLPIYNKGADLSTVESRRTNISGFVTAGIRPEKLMTNLSLSAAPGLQFQVFDNSISGVLSEKSLLYNSGDAGLLAPGKIAKFSIVKSISWPNTVWHIRYVAIPDQQLGQLLSVIPFAVLAFFVLLSTLIFIVVRNALSKLKKFEAAAIAASKRLIAEDAVVDAFENAVITTDTNGLVTVFNKKSEQVLGYSEVEMLDRKTVLDIITIATINQHCELLARELKAKFDPDFNALITRCIIEGHDEQIWEFITKKGNKLTVPVGTRPLYSAHTRELLGYRIVF